MSGNRPIVLTVTPNPSLDFLYSVDSLVWDDANRVAAPRRRPGGQGINVARAVRALGEEAVALSAFGGDTGRDLLDALSAEQLPVRAVEVEGETRVFTGIWVTDTGRSLLLNPRGPVWTSATSELVLRACETAIAEIQPLWVACCGSIPPGADPELYRTIGELAHQFGCSFVADCDTPALTHVAPLCDLLVPNRHEARRLLQRDALDDEVEAARALYAQHQRTVAITLGSQGALLVKNGETWMAVGPEIKTGSAVGAGDAFLAALLIGLTRAAPAQALQYAVAAGTAVLISTGSQLVDKSAADQMFSRVTVMRFD